MYSENGVVYKLHAGWFIKFTPGSLSTGVFLLNLKVFSVEILMKDPVLFFIPCFWFLRGIPCLFERFSFLFHGFQGLGRDNKSLFPCLLVVFLALFQKKQGKQGQGKGKLILDFWPRGGLQVQPSGFHCLLRVGFRKGKNTTHQVFTLSRTDGSKKLWGPLFLQSGFSDAVFMHVWILQGFCVGNFAVDFLSFG